MFRIFAISIGALLFFGAASPSKAQTVGTCPPSLGEAYLDANNVRARIVNTGGLFYRGEPHVYEVPKNSGNNAIFAGAVWIGGMVDGTLRMSAARYGNNELWAGPIDDAGMPPADCGDYDRIYKVSLDDIATYDSTGVTTNDLREWPTGIGAPTLDASGFPVDLLDLPFESRKDRLIDLANGERPAVRGEQLVWLLMNDQGNVHNTTNTNPLGLEVHASAFAAVHAHTSIDETTLFHFRLRNRSTSDISDAFVGVYLDADLGNYNDDYIGADSLRGMGYFYNADDDDEGEIGYGLAPPALGIMFLEGPVAEVDLIDNDGDGETDEFGERLRTTMISPWGEQLRAYEGPASGPAFYRWMQGFWRSGDHYTVGDRGHGYSNRWTNFVYSGDPVSGSFWTEVNSDSLGTSNYPEDRRMLITSGPFSIRKNEENDFTIAITWARGNSNLDSIIELRKAADQVRFAFDNSGWDALRLYTKPIPSADPTSVSSVGLNFPDPFSETTTIRYQVSERAQVRLRVYDAVGKQISTLVNQIQPIGEYSIPFDGSNLPSGVYFYRLEIGHASATRSMVLLK